MFVYEKYNTSEKRKNEYKILTENKLNFNGNLIIIGYGSIANVLIYLIQKLVDIKHTIVIDKLEHTNTENVNFIKEELNRDNIENVLDFIKDGDIIIDCSTCVSSCALIEICNKKGASYINSNIQCWKDEKKTLYDIHQDVKELKKNIKVNSNILNSMGCNPGLVSLFMKLGLLEIIKNDELYYEFTVDKNKEGDFWAKIACNIELQVVHVSERDTQQSNVPKKINEYCNTWASTIDPFYKEELGLSEISLGTHEIKEYKEECKDCIFKDDNDYIILNKIGMFTKAQSWIPGYNKYIGNITSQDETYTIGKYLTCKDDEGKTIYKPSVYVVYHPCNETFMCLDELKERNLIQQENSRLFTSDLTYGCDNIGVTMFLKKGEVFWIGSKLNVIESREIFDNEINDKINATILQVVSGYLGGLVHIINLVNNSKKIGIINPENVPVYDVIEYILPFIGDFVFEKNSDLKLTKIQNDGSILETKEWNIENFFHN